MTDEMIKQKAESIFVQKDCDRMAANVRAAIITAASKMAIPASIVTEEAALEELIRVYGVQETTEVLDLIGMAPQFVKSAIGYSVDFNDLASASVNYDANKDEYDFFYREIEAKMQERQIGEEEKPMTM